MGQAKFIIPYPPPPLFFILKFFTNLKKFEI